MASTIATLLLQVEARLNLTNAGAEMSDIQISDELRLAFKGIGGTLPPVLHTTLALGNAYTAALVHDRLFFVSADGMPLFPWEYTSSGANIRVQPTAAARGDTLQVWYFVAPTIVTGSTLTVDTTCIFGNDWLEELAVIKASMETCLRQTSLSASNSPTDYGALYRTLGERYEAVYTAHQRTWDTWFQSKERELQARDTNGPDPVSYSGHVGFRNLSQKRNWLTGSGDEGVPS